jgi:hypothetical protein
LPAYLILRYSCPKIGAAAKQTNTIPNDAILIDRDCGYRYNLNKRPEMKMNPSPAKMNTPLCRKRSGKFPNPVKSELSIGRFLPVKSQREGNFDAIAGERNVKKHTNRVIVTISFLINSVKKAVNPMVKTIVGRKIRSG